MIRAHRDPDLRPFLRSLPLQPPGQHRPLLAREGSDASHAGQEFIHLTSIGLRIGEPADVNGQNHGPLVGRRPLRAGLVHGTDARENPPQAMADCAQTKALEERGRYPAEHVLEVVALPEAEAAGHIQHDRRLITGRDRPAEGGGAAGRHDTAVRREPSEMRGCGVPDKAGCQRYTRVDSGWPEVVVVPRGYCRQPDLSGLVYSQMGRLPTREMAHPPVTVQHRCRRALLNGPDLRIGVDLPVPHLPYVGGRRSGPVAEHAPQIRPDLKIGNQTRPVIGHAHLPVELTRKRLHLLRHHPDELRRDDVHSSSPRSRAALSNRIARLSASSISACSIRAFWLAVK